jgi:cysteine synthase A
MKVNNILETIGNTPHVRINRLFPSTVEVWMKMEKANPCNSIKDRIGLAMIEDAERKGLINKDTVIIEPTSGNTGIGLAMVAAIRGYRLILTMPESMSLERRRYLAALGAELVLTPREKGLGGALERAAELLTEHKNSWMPAQFNNPANVAVHRDTTAREIIADFPEGLDYLITGVGTGGHITGCAETLKKTFPKLQVLAVEPTGSPVLSGGVKGLHPIQGIGAGFVPEILDMDLLDGIIKVEPADAFDFARRCVREEGIFVGISTGASLAAVNSKIANMPKGSRVLTFAYDSGERYLSVDVLFQ